ncbi:MAG: hypothetical protein LBB61_00840, partial [Treponema sp.]|nr:hypothetical protein [Treponema sp.]
MSLRAVAVKLQTVAAGFSRGLAGLSRGHIEKSFDFYHRRTAFNTDSNINKKPFFAYSIRTLPRKLRDK